MIRARALIIFTGFFPPLPSLYTPFVEKVLYAAFHFFPYNPDLDYHY